MITYLSTNKTAIEYAKSIIDDKELFKYLNLWFSPTLYLNDAKLDEQFECSIHTFIFRSNHRFNQLTEQEQNTAIDWITTEIIREADCNQIDNVAKVTYHPTEQKLQIQLLGYW